MRRALTRLLGALLAGGQSRRFGSDKAEALLGGVRLVDHARAAIARQVDVVIMCGGGVAAGQECLTDRPQAGLGPLGGLNAALHYAAQAGYDGVLCAPIDVVPLPPDLSARLGPAGPAVVAGQHAIGLWPATLAPMLDAHIAAGHRSFRSWIERCGARTVEWPGWQPVNINRVEDLEGLGS